MRRWERDAAEREAERRRAESEREEARDRAKAIREAIREAEEEARQQATRDQVANILGMTREDHLARAAEIYATPVSTHERAERYLHTLVELHFAMLKGEST